MKQTVDVERAIGDIGSHLSKWRREHPGTAAASAAAIDLLNAAEQRLAPGIPDDTDSTTWHDYLYSTGVPDFLEFLLGPKAGNAGLTWRFAPSTVQATRC
jgi:hypothetical protein